jgi:hypothetical protein
MEIAIYLLLGGMVILVISVWIANWKIKKMEKRLGKQDLLNSIRTDLEKLRLKLELVDGRLKQAETVDLDLTVLEQQFEENTQQMLTFFRERVHELSSRIADLEKQMEKYEDEDPIPAERISDLEKRVDEMEEELEEISENNLSDN